MAIWSPLAKALGIDTYDAAQRVLPPPAEPWMGAWSVADPGVPLESMINHKALVDHFWRTQPNVRKVVDFIARSVATIPLHTFERVSEVDRARVSDHPLSQLLSSPGGLRSSPFQFWRNHLSDGLLYDRRACLYTEGSDGPTLTHIPSWRLHLKTDALNRVVQARYWVGTARPDLVSDEQWVLLPLEDLIFSHGYAPAGAGYSPLETLKDVLLESSESVKYRRQTWANSARVPAWIERPPDKPWSETARRRFLAGFRASFTGGGENAGGTPLLEDGMRLNELRAFSPQDLQDLEGRRLTAIEVASAFHMAPELIGAREGNYSNIKELRQSLYRDNLGPYITDWEQSVDKVLVPRLAAGRALYVEANVESKLRGSFEEQAQVLSTAIGAPWMGRDEGRARMNLPFKEGTEALIVPLNVLEGGQANPRDSGTQNLNSRRTVSLKSRIPETYKNQAEKLLSGFFRRQRAAVLSALGAKSSAAWWDGDRWDDELTTDLLRLAELFSVQAASSTLEELGVDPDSYDTSRTLAFLRSVSERVAGSINSTTYSQIQATLASTTESDRAEELAHVFDVAETSRAERSAVTAVTVYSAFGTAEAAKQVGGEQSTKTWITTSGNPRSSHAKMDGQTVPLSENFSNGAAWPGDAMALDVDDIAGCKCDITIQLGG